MAFELTDIESICMEMISTAGEGRSKVFEAIDAYKAGEYEKCRELITESEDLLNKAHNIQFLKLMKPQANGEQIPFNILLIHAMDLLMVSSSEKDIVKRFIDTVKQKEAAE